MMWTPKGGRTRTGSARGGSLLSQDKLADLREETRAIIQHVRECLAAACNLEKELVERAVDSSMQAIESSNALLARLRTMQGLVHEVDVHIARAGDKLTTDLQW